MLAPIQVDATLSPILAVEAGKVDLVGDGVLPVLFSAAQLILSNKASTACPAG